MPLDDAMRLVGQNFDQYMQDLRERAKSSSSQESSKTKTTAPKDEAKTDISSLLSKAASGEDLSADQLTKLIDNLSKRQEQILGSSAAANGKGGVTASQSSQPAVDPQSIAKQQADLQAKILSILNPGGGAKTSSVQNTGSLASQQTVSPGQKPGAVTAPVSQGAGKPAALSTTVKPIFPLYPTQQKPAAPAASTAVSTAKAPVGAAAAKPLSSTPSNQAYQSASPYGATARSSSYNAISMAGNQATSYQMSKPVTQNTYTAVSNQATAAAASSAVYSAKTVAAPASQANWLQRISQQSSSTSASIPVVSKVTAGGQAVVTAVGPRPAVNTAPRAVAPTAVGGRRPASTFVGQMRTPSPSLLGAPPVGTPRVLGPSGAVRTPTSSVTPGVRMVAPRGPSPVGRGVVRTSSPAGLQGQTVPSRGGAISVRGGTTSVPGGATSFRGGLAGATGRGSLATQATRGGPAQRGAVVVRGAPSPRGVPASRGVPVSRGAPATRGTPALRGAPVARGAPIARGAPTSSGAVRGSPVTRGTPYMRGAPNARGTPPTRGSPISTVTSNRGAPRGRPMMRGGPPYRGGVRGGY